MYPEGKRILVIDDDARRRELCERVLIEEGFAVTAVPEGFSAIRAAQSGRFALAIAAVGFTMPKIVRMSEVFPAPFDPTMATTSPLMTSSETSSSA